MVFFLHRLNLTEKNINKIWKAPLTDTKEIGPYYWFPQSNPPGRSSGIGWYAGSTCRRSRRLRLSRFSTQHYFLTKIQASTIVGIHLVDWERRLPKRNKDGRSRCLEG